MSAVPAEALEAPIERLIGRELPAAASGCPHAYGRIVAASQNTVTAVALAITRDVPASEDIAQEAFLKAWQQLGRLNSPSSFLPWLRQITRNLAHDHLRASRRRPLDGEVAELAISRAADPAGTPVRQLIDAERQAVAAELISELPEDSREVLLLYYREGQNSRQVAELLGLSDAAVRKRLSRARRCLRTELVERFREFASGSAPGTAFALTVVAALGGFTKPAAAAGLTTAGSTVAGGILGKLLLGGSAAAAGGGLLSGLLTAWLCRRFLARYADNAQERRAILRCYNTYLWTCLAMLAAAVALAFAFTSRIPAYAAVLATLAVATYQLLGPLARLMAPLVRRDSARNPDGAWKRELAYRLTFGPSGAVISNLCVLGLLAIMHLQGA
ncbi:sigma-70 family RNA polymerase sigma factor [Luteimonas sp. RD2P54]|uniref:RNA polymerase sigma factor n=1 Tax=Luteimonas endophytica TaxID=3042023 RepID=A0ABT6JBA3_9GAMM|nr:sigma-70 family RNA polymerase sigma factor [Luteimonas endophytica]MDH5824112.1 sigma-70 family RNA polymerase sigma factor [Luteimonas endophytica]